MVAKIFSIVGNPVVGGPLSIKKILANFSSGFLDEYYHKSSKLIVLDWSCTTPSNFLDFGSSKFSKGETLLLIVVPPQPGWDHRFSKQIQVYKIWESPISVLYFPIDSINLAAIIRW